MVTVTISKKEYQKLLKKAFLYEYLRQVLKEDIFSPPPAKDVKQVIRSFKTTNKYNKNFLAVWKEG